MIILLGSKNPSKFRALSKALAELKIDDVDIEAYDVPSGVHPRPVGFEIIRGAENRNSELKKLARVKKIKYDYLCSIEGGVTLDESGIPYIVSYCAIENSEGKKNIGKSLCLGLTQPLFDYIKEEGSLNRIIEKLENSENWNQRGGITGYLSNGLFDREKIDRDVVMSTFMPFIYEKMYDKLEDEIRYKVS